MKEWGFSGCEVTADSHSLLIEYWTGDKLWRSLQRHHAAKLAIVGKIVCSAQGHILAFLSPQYLFMASFLLKSNIILPLLASSSADATLALRVVFFFITEMVFFLFFQVFLLNLCSLRIHWSIHQQHQQHSATRNEQTLFLLQPPGPVDVVGWWGIWPHEASESRFAKVKSNVKVISEAL